MAGVTIDSIVVDSRFAPEGFSAGLAESTREFQQFIQRTSSLSAPIIMDLRLNGAAQAAAEAANVREQIASSVSPAAFEAFSQATTQAFGQIAEALNALNATIGSIMASAERFIQGFSEAAQQELEAFAARAKEATAAAEALQQGVAAPVSGLARMNAGFAGASAQAAELSREVRDQVAGNEAWARGVANLTSAQEKGTAAIAAHEAGTKKAVSALALLAATSVNAAGPVSQLAQSALLLGGGTQAVAGVAIATIGAAAAFQELTKRAREAQERTDSAIASLLKMHEAERDPIRVRAELTGTAAAEVDRLRARIIEVTDAIRDLEKHPEPIVVGTTTVSAEERMKGLVAQVKLLAPAFLVASQAAATGARATEQAQVEQFNRVREQQEAARSEELRAIDVRAQLVQSGINDLVARRQLNNLLPILAARERDLSLEPEKRLEAHQRILAILAAQEAPLQRQFSLENQSAQVALRRVQTLQQQAQGIFTPIGIRVDVGQAIADLGPVQDQLDKDIARADELAKHFEKLNAPGLADAFRQQAESFRQTQAQIDNIKQVFGELPVTDAIANLQNLVAQVQRQADRGQIAIPVRLDDTDVIQQAQAIRDQLAERIAQFQAADQQPPQALVAAFNQLTDGLQVAADLPAATITQAADRASQLLDASLAAIEARRAAATGLFDLGPSVKDTETALGAVGPFIDALRARYAQVGSEIDAINASSERQKSEAAQLIALYQEQARIAKQLHDVTVATNLTRRAANAQALTETQEALGVFTQVGQAIGFVDDRTNQWLQSLSDVAGAIANIELKGANFSSIVGVIGAGAGLLGGLFGQSDSERERIAILKANNDRLAELAAALDHATQGIGGTANAGQAAAFLALNNTGDVARAVQQFGGPQAGIDVLNDQLERFHLTFAQLNEIAKQNGIQLLDSKGRVVAGAFDQLADAIGVTLDQMTRFADSFQGQLDFADLKARINGTSGDALAQFQRDLEAAGASGSSFVQHFFDGIDPTKDQDAFRQRLNEFADLFGPNSDFFKNHPELLGGLTPEDWQKILNDGASAMDLFNQAVKDTTDRLADFNIPDGFRRAALAFQNSDTGPASPPPVAPPLRGNDFLPIVSIGDGGEIGSSFARTTTVHFEAGAIVVHAAPGQSPEAVAAAVLAEFRRTAMSQTGDTLQIPVF